jgi:hypothetical protein
MPLKRSRLLAPKATVIALTACATAIGPAAPCRADVPDWRASVGAFLPVDVPSGTRDGAGVTLAVSRTVWREAPSAPDAVRASLRYTEYTLKGDQRIRLFHPMLEYERQLSGSRRRDGSRSGGLYGGVGAGLVFGDNSAGGSTTHLAYTAFLDYDWQPILLEARLLRGSHTGEHGVALSLGAHW